MKSTSSPRATYAAAFLLGALVGLLLAPAHGAALSHAPFPTDSAAIAPAATQP